MKSRFFLILLFSLSAVGISLSISFSYYLNASRLELLDLQLRDSAITLVNSELSDIKKINFAEAEQLISEELGSDRIGKIFIIRNDNDEILFKSGSASLMDIDPPRSPQTYSYNVKDQTVRVLNLKLPKRPGRTLQIGAVLDPSLFDWGLMSNKLVIYLVITIIPIFIFSLALTNYLLDPLKIMANHLQLATRDLQELRPVPGLPKKLFKYTKKSIMNNDEFSTLVESTNNLLERININYKMTKPWTYQLAHEIKTPLSILSFDVESLSDEDLKDKTLITSMKDQIDRISIIVSQFLEWASVENTQQKDNLFALRIANSIETQSEGLERLYPGRLVYKVKEDFMVISNPQHLQQLINNLLTNALNYSPNDSEVLIETFDNMLRVSDSGSGIPVEVIERIGQPFNCGPQLPQLKHKRSGLGLAWINTITKIYNWNLGIQSGANGTVMTIRFTKNLTT